MNMQLNEPIRASTWPIHLFIFIYYLIHPNRKGWHQKARPARECLLVHVPEILHRGCRTCVQYSKMPLHMLKMA